jgi:hypothetical protein
VVRKLLLAVFWYSMRCIRLESESERISASTNAAHPKSRVKLIAIVAIVAVSIVIGAFLVSGFISSPQGGTSPNQDQDGTPINQDQNDWLFKGAYATYEGSTTFTSDDIDMQDMSMDIDFNVRVEVVDFNTTHALISTSFQMSSSINGMDGETVEDENSTWVPLSQMGFMGAFDDVNLTSSYKSTVDVAGLGTRSCTVYEYAISDEGLSMKVYVDDAIDWPLKMTVSMSGENSISLSLDINLIDTNIPALK